MQAGTIFVGREREMARLGEGLGLAVTGSGALVLVTGEPGAGKTRLLQEFAARASDRGVRVLWGTCHQEQGRPPYWPIVEALRSYIQDCTAAKLQAEMGTLAADITYMVPELRHRLPSLPQAPPLHDPDAARFRCFDSVAQFLQLASASQPILLVLEDIHWADRSSLLFLEFLAHELARARMLVVCSYRDTELQPRDPLTQALGEISRHGVLARIALQGLSEGDIRAYLEVAAGHTPPEGLVHALRDHTEGNPLFVAETVRHLAEEGQLHPGHWHAQRAWKIGIPAGVHQVIGKRLGHLPAQVVTILSTAAVMGRQFGLGELQALVQDVAPDDLAGALEAALAARIIEELSDHPWGYQFSHALVRETLYDSLGLARRLQLHRHVGQVLEALHARDPVMPVDQLAHHYCAAGSVGDPDKAVAYATHAAARAEGALAYDESAHYCRMALEALEWRQPRDEARRRQLVLALGESYRRAGATLEAVRTLDQAAELARQAGAKADMARAALSLEEATWRPGLSGTLAVHRLREALEAVGEGDQKLRTQLTASLARALIYAGEIDHGLALGREAVEVARRVGDPGVLAMALRSGLSARWRPEMIHERIAAAREMAARAEQAGDRDLALEAYSWLMFDLLETGDIQSMDATFDTQAQLARELRQPFYLYVHASLLGARATWEGRFGDAEERIREALVIGQKFRGQGAFGTFGIQMFTLRRAQGRLREIEPHTAAFVRHYSEAYTWRPGLALIYSELGRRKEAQAEFERMAADDFASLSRDANWPACLVYLSEVCTFLGDRGRARTLYRLLLPFSAHNVVVGPTAACYGSASHYLGMLAATMRDWALAEKHFLAALAMNERIRARPWLAQTRHAYAEMLLLRNRGDDPARARILLLAALSVARELGMQALAERAAARLSTGPRSLPAGLAGGDRLTPRELEVLRLVTSGRTNREIAEALVVSVHTVANHVKNILGKTQTGNRTELTAYAMRQNLVNTEESESVENQDRLRRNE